MVIQRSFWFLPCFSTSMCAPVAARMALMLLPARPMTREMACTGTWTFLQAFCSLDDDWFALFRRDAEVLADRLPELLADALAEPEAPETAGDCCCCTELLRITSFQPSSRLLCDADEDDDDEEADDAAPVCCGLCAESAAFEEAAAAE